MCSRWFSKRERPVVRLVTYDFEPLSSEAMAKLEWFRAEWLPGKTGGRTFDFTEEYVVEPTRPVEEMFVGPDGQEGGWWWWFNTYDEVAAVLGGIGTYSRQLIVSPWLYRDGWKGGNGTMRATAISAGRMPRLLSSPSAGMAGDPGWAMAAGVVGHEMCHSFGLPDLPWQGNEYRLMWRGFVHLPAKVVGFDKVERDQLRGVLA
jgi:hypothetical protein